MLGSCVEAPLFKVSNIYWYAFWPLVYHSGVPTRQAAAMAGGGGAAASAHALTTAINSELTRSIDCFCGVPAPGG